MTIAEIARQIKGDAERPLFTRQALSQAAERLVNSKVIERSGSERLPEWKILNLKLEGLPDLPDDSIDEQQVDPNTPAHDDSGPENKEVVYPELTVGPGNPGRREWPARKSKGVIWSSEIPVRIDHVRQRDGLDHFQISATAASDANAENKPLAGANASTLALVGRASGPRKPSR